MTATAFAATLTTDQVQEVRMVLAQVADEAVKAPGAGVAFERTTEGQDFHEILDSFLDAIDVPADELDYTNPDAISFAENIETRMHHMFSAAGQDMFLGDCRNYYYANN